MREVQDLPFYNPNACCPKCGGTRAAVAHREYYCGGAFHERCAGDHGEHMHRTCFTCGYRWPEAPLDTDERDDWEDEDEGGDAQSVGPAARDA